jgi:PEP-CTERM motif
VPFSDANSLSDDLFEPSPIDSWERIDHYHTVQTSAPEIGHPVGVGFSPRSDSAVDDASLSVDPAEDVVLMLEVNTTNGQTTIKNQTGETVHIDYYEITSAGNSLNEASWNSFQNPAGNPPGFPSINGGSGWKEAGGSDDGVLSESYLNANSGVPNGAPVSLGAAFTVGDAQDVVFRYGWVKGTGGLQEGDYNGDGVVDAADYVTWRKMPSQFGGPAGYNTWRANFGELGGGGPDGVGRLTTGLVRYVTAGNGAAVPEPSSLILVSTGIVGWSVIGRRKKSDR